jgi:hypothetical protein
MGQDRGSREDKVGQDSGKEARQAGDKGREDRVVEDRVSGDRVTDGDKLDKMGQGQTQ